MDTQFKPALLRAFPDFDEPLLSELLEYAVVKRLEAGEEALRTGQYLRSNMLLLSGLLKIYREDQEGNEFLMYYLEPGEGCALSMMCVARPEQSQVMARAVEDSAIVLIPAEKAELWLGLHKTWHNFVIATYRRRFEELLETFDSVVFKNMGERLLFYLRRHLDTQGANLEASHQQIAYELNTSREVISRLLKKLEQRGAVALHRNYVEILDLEVPSR